MTKKSNIILGIHGDFLNKKGVVNESSCSLVIDGKLVSCIAEERITRKKVDGGFPVNAINEVLRINNISSNDIDQVAFTSSHPAISSGRYLKSVISTYLDTGVFLKEKFKLFLESYLYHKIKTPKKIPYTLYDNTFDINFVDHHFGHAAGAYYASPFDNALVITLDGGGDGLDGGAFYGKKNELTQFLSIPHYQSPGTMYSAVTHDMGFIRHRHEGKITGLAAYGNPDFNRLGLSDLIKYDVRKHRFISKKIADHHKNLKSRSKYFGNLFEKFPREDIAAATQAIFEVKIIEFIKDAFNVLKKKNISTKNICLAGGCFANVKANQKILELGLFDNIFIFPAMGDDGLSAGAALYTYHKYNKKSSVDSRIDHIYLGGEFSATEIEHSLKRFDLEYQYSKEIEKEVGLLLSQGKIIGRFNGKMEYGPRSLGNRSILGAPFDPQINDWLNKKLKRTEFMPFAPSILHEFADDYLVNYKNDHVAPDFMTITYDIKPGMKEKIPAVVHIDNTARPQIVRKETNESYHKIIHEFYRITGVPVVLNTSFNMHEEPIVYTPDDAIRGFLSGKIDYLAIGDYLVKNNNIEG